MYERKRWGFRRGWVSERMAHESRRIDTVEWEISGGGGGGGGGGSWRWVVPDFAALGVDANSSQPARVSKLMRRVKSDHVKHPARLTHQSSF